MDTRTTTNRIRCTETRWPWRKQTVYSLGGHKVFVRATRAGHVLTTGSGVYIDTRPTVFDAALTASRWLRTVMILSRKSESR